MLVTVVKSFVFAICIAVATILIARFVFAIPAPEGRVNTEALPPSETGALASALMPLSLGHENLSGIAALQNGSEAFVARMLLADAATSSIDVQYYIWRADITGHLLLDALHRAAKRGVRVRLLLDDNGISGLDAKLAMLDAHPNIEGNRPIGTACLNLAV